MIGLADLAAMAWQARRQGRATRDALVACQDERLRRLVGHAYDNVPYYRAMFERHHVDPAQIRSAKDLARLPVSTKADLRAARAEDVVARVVDPGRLLVHMTSGSSGEPLTIRRTWIEERVGSLFHLRALRDFGVRPWHTRAGLSIVRPHDPRDWDTPGRLLRALGLFRRAALDCRQPVPELARAVIALRPDVITGYPGVIAQIGHAIAQDRSGGSRPRLVITGGEVLTPLLRRHIGERFRAPVFEIYGTHELGTIAWQCPRSGVLHAADDAVIVEVLKDGRPAEPGEAGEVVVTRLHALAMPFIRYRLGDIVTRGDASCPCGAPFSTILTVQGRMLDYFPLVDGRVLHPYEVVAVILAQAARWLGQYQLTQERADRVVLRVVPLSPPSPAEVADLERAARAILGSGIEFQARVVDRMPFEPNGKFRVSRSLVVSVYDGIDWERQRADDLAALRAQRDEDRRAGQ